MRTAISVCSCLTAMLGVMLSDAGCRKQAEAQVAMDPLGPIDCFLIVDDMEIASTSAIDVCAGATSDAPGRCMEAGIDTGVLTTQQTIDLCRGATSLAPFACFEQLSDRGTLTNDQMIDYCGMRCPLGPPPPEAGNAECLGAALDRADLPEQSSAELCVRAASAGPVDCFVAGLDTTELADSQLIQLCAETTSCQYVNAPAAASY